MSSQNEQGNPAKSALSAVEVMDAELMREGWTREQLDEQRRAGDFIAEKLAEGYSVEKINAEWEAKNSQETEQAPATDRRQLNEELSRCKRSQLLRIISVMGWSHEVSENADNDRLIALLLDNAVTPQQRYDVHCAVVQVTRNPS